MLLKTLRMLFFYRSTKPNEHRKSCLTFGFLSLLLILFSNNVRAENYEIDPLHSSIHFDIDHLGYSNLVGRFNDFSGNIYFDTDNPSKASARLEINSASVDTGYTKRDRHLRSPDLINCSEFPKIVFETNSVELANESDYKIEGDLILLGRAKSILLNISLNKHMPYPMPPKKGIPTLGLSATFNIDRTLFGMKYGIPNIGAKVQIRLEIEAHKKTQ